MMAKPGVRAGVPAPARPESAVETNTEKPIAETATKREDTASMAVTQGQDLQQARPHPEGVTVIGEAVRRVSPEQAEFLIEITAGAPTATQALRDNQARTAQVLQAVSALGVQPSDMQTIGLNVVNVYAPVMPALPAYAAMPQIGHQDVQFGSYQAKNTLRVSVRDVARVGEIVDTAIRSGASAVSR
jgi:uncharacterized protein YggE